MFCQKCAHKLVDGAKFCNKCGHSVNGSANEKHADAVDMALPASTLRRLSNHIVDGIAAYILSLGFVLLGSLFSDTGAMIMTIIGVVLFFGYHLICESIWQRTIGKLLTKTKVVDREGNKPGFLKILGRSFARYIPFEPLSFLFGGHPIGWHDSLSKTLVVPVELTPVDVRRMDFEEIRKLKSNNVAATVVVVIIVMLFMIAIIGILSSVVLVSLNSARQKASDAAVKASMSSLGVQGILYQDRNGSYSGFCNDPEVMIYLKSASESANTDQIESNFVCNDNTLNWAAAVPLKSGGYWCVDDSSDTKVIATDLTIETSCSGHAIYTGTSNSENWSTYTSQKDHFSVSFPRSPTLDSKVGVPTGDSFMSWYSYESEDTSRFYYVYRYVYSDGFNTEDPDQVLKAFLNIAVDSDDANQLVSSSFSYYSGYRALDFQIKNGAEVVKGKYISVGDELYLIMMSSLQKDYNTEIYNQFINSFTIQ